MTDPHRITCPCGYENWVPEEKRGQTITCPMCGHELIVEQSIALGVSPESGGIPQARPRSPNVAAAAKPRSPFEADEMETAVRPKFEYEPPRAAPVAPAAPRERSPFEASTAETEAESRERGKLVAGPFSLDLAPAPAKGPSTIDQMETHRPKAGRARHTFIDTISPHDVPTGEKCAQCGRELRGSWDRHESAAGVLCYVCSNQGTHGVPDRLKAGVPERREIRERDLVAGPLPPAPPPVEDRAWFLDTKSDGFKKALALMAVLVLGAALFVAITGWGTPDRQAIRAAQQAALQQTAVPDFVKYILWAGRVLGGILMPFIAIYLTLDRDEHLPHDTFGRNALQIGAVVGLLTGVSIVAYIAYIILIGIFVAGKIWLMFLGVPFMFMQISILTNMLDFRVRDFFWLYLFYMPLAGGMLYIIGLFLKWGLYALVAV